MSSMTLQQIRDHVLGVAELDSADIPTAVLDRFIGEGFNLIAYSERRWPFYEVETSFNTVANQKDYTKTVVGNGTGSDGVTQGLRDIAHLRNEDHVIGLIGRDDGDEAYPLDSNDTGEPWNFAYWGEQVRLYPTPSAVEKIYVRGYRNATAFPSDPVNPDTAATPDLPEPFHIVVANYAIARVYQQQEDPQMAATYDQLVAVELDNLARRYAGTPLTQPMVLNRQNLRHWGHWGRLRYSWE
tara:strand:- start:78 stop:800 length:723 start_codon:yes stop_codon:yes gene_type:complete